MIIILISVNYNFQISLKILLLSQDHQKHYGIIQFIKENGIVTLFKELEHNSLVMEKHFVVIM